MEKTGSGQGNLSGWVCAEGQPLAHGEGFPSSISREFISCQRTECGDLGGASLKPKAAFLSPDVWLPQLP